MKSFNCRWIHSDLQFCVCRNKTYHIFLPLQRCLEDSDYWSVFTITVSQRPSWRLQSFLCPEQKLRVQNIFPAKAGVKRCPLWRPGGLGSNGSVSVVVLIGGFEPAGWVSDISCSKMTRITVTSDQTTTLHVQLVFKHIYCSLQSSSGKMIPTWPAAAPAVIQWGALCGCRLGPPAGVYVLQQRNKTSHLCSTPDMFSCPEPERHVEWKLFKPGRTCRMFPENVPHKHPRWKVLLGVENLVRSHI